MKLSLERIRTDGGTQSREKIYEEVIAEYADAMQDGAKFPPVIVFHDGVDYWLADGFHRYFAAKKVGSPGIECDVKEGTRRDAVLFSYSANPNHGLRRTAADKRKVVTGMLLDIEWQEWSDRTIAKHCNVSHTLVAAIRKELGAEKKQTTYKKGDKIVTRQEKPKQEKAEEDPVATYSEADAKLETMQAAVNKLQDENESLQDQLIVAMAASTDDIQKEKAESIIRDLRAQIRALEIELKAVKGSRDAFQAENAQLMKQVQMLQKKLKKLEG